MPRPKAVPYDFPQIDVFDASISDNLLGHYVISALTPREVDIFASLVRGRLTKLIAADLRVSKRTVDIHRSRIMKKLKLKSIAEEAVLGWRIRETLTGWVVCRAFQRRCETEQRVAGASLTTSIIPCNNHGN